MPKPTAEEKPQRLYFKSYLQMVKNSVDSNLFRNFYVKSPSGDEFDAFKNGEDSCAFFVSSVLVIMSKINAFHGTVLSTVKDLRKSGWRDVNSPRPGDVLVWEKVKGHEHIGFYIGRRRAISNSSKSKTPVEHDMNFGPVERKITCIYRMEVWDGKP